MTHANAPRTTRSSARRRNASAFSDAVVAAYIHEISTHNRRPSPRPMPRAARERRGPSPAGAASLESHPGMRA
jgi:hypothetical protein